MLNSSQTSGPLTYPTNRGIFKDIRRVLKRDERQQESFRVRFGARSNFVATLGNTRFDANVNLEVLDSTRQRVIAASKRLAGRPELIELKNLAPGTYYVQAVLARGKQSRYRLRVNTTPIADAGAAPSTARFLDVTTPIQVSEFIGAEDSSDFYAFTIGSAGFPSGRLNLRLGGENGDFLNGNVTVKIRDSLLNVVRERRTNSRIGFNLDEPLAAGTYFLEVNPANSLTDETNYSVTLSTTAIPDLAGNTPNAARVVNLSATDSLFQDFVGAGDFQDYYKFTVPKSTFNLKLTGPNGNLLGGEVTVRLRNEVNTVLEPRTSGNGAGLTIDNKALPPGTYTVQISTSARSVNYALLMSAQPD